MKAVFVLPLAVMLVACSAKDEPKINPQQTKAQAVVEREITGQVFVTQKNGQSIKLGNVTVTAVEFAVAQARLDTARSNSVELLKPVEAPILAAKESEARASKASEEAEKALANATANTANLDFSRQLEVLTPFRERSHNALNASIKALEELIRVRKKAQEQSRKLTPGALAFSEPWPGQLANAKTDADGNFTIKIPAKEVVLVATSGRMLPDSVEDYYWVVTVATNHSGKLLLNNANMLAR